MTIEIWNRNIAIGINSTFASSNSLSDIDKKKFLQKTLKKTNLCRILAKVFSWNY